jgi:hypothetical protein
MEFFASGNVVLHSTRQVFVIVRVGVQIVEIFNFTPGLKMLFAIAFFMIAYQHKLLALMLRKFSLESELLFGKLKCFTYGCFIINTSEIKYFDKILAGLV